MHPQLCGFIKKFLSSKKESSVKKKTFVGNFSYFKDLNFSAGAKAPEWKPLLFQAYIK